MVMMDYRKKNENKLLKRSPSLGVLTLLVGVVGLTSCSQQDQGAGSAAEQAQSEAQVSSVEVPDVGNQAEQFTQMLDSHVRAFLKNAPETATQLGVSEELAGAGYNGRLSSNDFDADQTARTMNEVFLTELKGISRSSLPTDMAITYDILRTSYEAGAQRNQFEFGGTSYWGSGGPYRLTQLSGVHLWLPRLLQVQQPLSNTQDIENYLSRMAGFAKAFDETGQMMQADAELGVVPPVFALRGISGSLKNFSASAPDENPLVVTLVNKISKIDGVDEEAVSAYQARAVEIIEDSIYPAYNRLEATVTGMIPLSVEGAGIWRLGPQGEEFYQHALDGYGAQGRSGSDIHALGLQEVARITAQMDETLIELGLSEGSVAERMSTLGQREENLFPNTDEGRDALLESLRGQVTEIMGKADQWFGVLPSQPVEVRRIAVHEQDTSPGGYYTGPSLDGSRPGIYWINLKDTADNPKQSLKTLTYHEAVPGHHFQISLQRAIKGLPLIRNMMGFSEFSEGWALYSEQLAVEMGMYENDPLSNLGRLQAEIFRAARLVVDSGLHSERWSREQAIDYMVNVTGETRASLTREVERYSVWPGQATSYKLGMLKIGELRERAEAELGEAFSISEFHDEVLLTGSMPLGVLEAKIDRWIASKKQG